MGSTAFAYLLENGFYVLLYIPNSGVNGHNQFLSSTFGPHIDSISKIQPELVIHYLRHNSSYFINYNCFQGLPKLMTNESQFLNQIIENIENLRKKSMRVCLTFTFNL